MESTANLFNGTRDAFQIEATDRSYDIDAAATFCHKQVILGNTVGYKTKFKSSLGNCVRQKKHFLTNNLAPLWLTMIKKV